MFSALMNDYLSKFFLFFLIAIFIPVLIYSIGYVDEYKKNYSTGYFWSLLILFCSSMIGVIVSKNSITFMVFWEIMSISSFFLVIFEYKKKESLKAGILYFIMTHISGLFLMVMFSFIYKYTGRLDFTEIILLKGKLTPHRDMIFIFALLGFGAKAGLLPLHAWLPKAHPAAPSNVSALMSGVMLKVAVYGFIRVVFMFLGGVSYKCGFVVLILGTITALYTIFNSLLQNDLKKMLAYSSAENIGIIFATLGLALILKSFNFNEASIITLTAALFHTFNHGVFKSLLFTGAGSVLYATSTKNINELGGLAKKMKFIAICSFIGTAAISAVPPLNGFASESLIFMSFINSAYLIKNKLFVLGIILCGITLVLVAGAAFFSAVKAFGITYLGDGRSKKAEEVHSVPFSMKLGMAILSIYSILLGVFAPFAVNNISKVAVDTLSMNYYTKVNIVGYEITLVALLLIIIVLGIVLVNTLLDKNKKVENYETWGCGFNQFKGNMQYSADGYSQPAARVFGCFAGYKKESIVKNTIVLKQRVYDLIEEKLYYPIVNLFRVLSAIIVKIHYGQVQLYIMYIFLSLIISITLVIKFI